LQIKYTQGDMEVARKYFGQAIKLNSNNMRALFGYYLVRIRLCPLLFDHIVSVNPSGVSYADYG